MRKLRPSADVFCLAENFSKLNVMPLGRVGIPQSHHFLLFYTSPTSLMDCISLDPEGI